MFSRYPSNNAHWPRRGQAPLASVELVIGAPRQRHEWLRCEVRCLMCGRPLGRLLGVSRIPECDQQFTTRPVAFVAFRPLDPPGPVVAYRVPRIFRCRTCRGSGAVDEIEFFSTFAEVTAADEPAAKRGRGRPPRPFQDTPRGTPLQRALAAL